MYSSKLFKLILALIGGICLYAITSDYATAREINLNPEFSKKCGITFRYPDNMDFYLIPVEESDTICILAYRFKNRGKRIPPTKTTVDGWREISDGGFEIKSISINRRLNEFNFEEIDNSIKYIGQPQTELSERMGYLPESIEPIKVIENDDGVLYMGRSSLEKLNFKSKRKTNLKRINLLLGNQYKSVGQIIWESTDDNSSRGMTEIFEKIFLSMKLI